MMGGVQGFDRVRRTACDQEVCMKKKRPTEQELIEGLDVDGAHADELAEPLSNELEPLEKLKDSVKKFERPTDSAADTEDWDAWCD